MEAIDERARALVETRPQNLLWGSDWPHVGLRLPPPDGTELRSRLDRWAADPVVRQQLLVDNAMTRTP